jgi:pimeloyl-ACP methyl ester carboxylesterase
MANVVIVAGGWHGGCEITPFARRLRALGHDVFTPTLTGLGERVHLAAARPNLDTHILDVANVLEFEDLSDVVLCAHSYGGMVITGVADRMPERISALVYIDALVPEDGESWWDLVNDHFRAIAIDGADEDGFSVRPPAHMDPRCRPHPMASFLQKIRLAGRWKEVREKLFVYATGWADSPFPPTVERLKKLADWRVEEMATRHNIIAAAPDQFLAILTRLDAMRRLDAMQ